MDNNSPHAEECDSTRVKKGLKKGGGGPQFQIESG